MGISPKNELQQFLNEDIGKGDITSKLVKKKQIKAKIITREKCIVSGTNYIKQLFSLKNCKVKIIKNDGSLVKPNQVIVEITGLSSSVLMCERTALNLLSRMSGIATETNEFVKKIKKTKSKLFSTRKTAPGLRFFDKYSVEIGGGHKHRMKLDEMVMIKDNHIAVHSSITAAKLGVNIILLDNFTPKKIKQVIKNLEKYDLRKKIKLEASGGINLKNIQDYAKTGVDMISVGTITNSPKSIDMSLEIF